MRQIIVTEFVSLDGVMEYPTWTVPYWNDEIAQFKSEESLTCDALLLGHKTYEGFAAAWPGSDDPGADRMNSLCKYVVTSTQEPLLWNNSQRLKGDLVAALAELKAQDGQDILVYGSATLVQALLQKSLVDELRLLVYPVVLGQGKRLFHEDNKLTLTLKATQIFSSGVVALIYHKEDFQASNANS